MKKPKKSKTIYVEKKQEVGRDIYLFDSIKPETVKEVIKEIIRLQKKSKKPITIYLNSPGGYLQDGFALIDVIKNSRCKIKIIALGEICSMAPAIFVAGTKGQRYIAKHASIMFHPITTGHHDYIQFVKSRLKNSEAIEKMYDDFILENTKLPKNKYREAKNKEIWFTAKEAIDLGIADKIWKKK